MGYSPRCPKTAHCKALQCGPNWGSNWGRKWGSRLMANNKLTALQVKAAGAGKLFDGGGLILNKSAPGQGF